MWVKIGAKKTAPYGRRRHLQIPGGAFPGSPVMNACLCAFGPYNIANARAVARTASAIVQRHRPIARRARRFRRSRSKAYSTSWPKDRYRPGAIAAQKRSAAGDHDDLRAKDEPRRLCRDAGGADQSSSLQDAARPQPGARCGIGLLVQRRRQSSATVQVNEDGTVIVSSGSVDVGGSRASMALMAAETLGVDYSQVRSIVADTVSVGYTNPTGGSRVTFATGMAVVEASKKIVDELRGAGGDDLGCRCRRCGLGRRPCQACLQQCRRFPPLSLKEIAAKKALTGGPLTAAASVNAGGQAPGFSSQFCDVEVDPETGKVTILRLRRGPGCRQSDPSLLCRRPDPGRRGSGDRLGVERGIHLRQERPAR